MPRKTSKSILAAAVTLGGIFGLIVDAPDVLALAVKVLSTPFKWLREMNGALGYWLLIVGGIASLAWIHFSDRVLTWLRARGIRTDWLIRRPIVNPIKYIGEMAVSDRHMNENLFLEIAARGFNIAESPIVIKRAYGYFSQSIVGSWTAWGVIPARSEFIVVFEQRLPRTIVDRLTKLETGKRVPLNFDKFNIVVALEMAQNNEMRIPVYDGIMLHRDPNKLLTSRIINASITGGRQAGSG